MRPKDYETRAVDSTGLDAFLIYLEDHLQDNGRNGVPLFQPTSRDTPWLGPERIASFRQGVAAEVGAPKWRRLWAAFNAEGAIAAHVDLQGRTEPHSDHRALLGMGVHRDHRRRGLGTEIVEHVLAWARRETAIEWIDLRLLGGNTPAEDLYRTLGFWETARVDDVFRIDGASIADVLLVKRIR